MKAAIVVLGRPEYRLYAPIIEAALARGWEVECWHDGAAPQTGPKGYQFPSVDSVPAFRHGSPVVRTFQGPRELSTWVAGGAADVVISLNAPEDALGSPRPPGRPFWVKLQFSFESFIGGGPEKVLTSDALALHSPWWLEWAWTYYEAQGLRGDREAFFRDAGRRASYVGLPELDAVANIDPAEVRHRWGIPPRQPVVVLFPFPQGVGRAAFWPKRIFGQPNRAKQLAHIVAQRRFEYLPHLRDNWSDRTMLRALRRFCDRNGAYLLIKSRVKTPVPPYALALADRCVYDERYYPATALEALSIASLSAGYYSNGVFESAAMAVPHLCLAFPLRDYLDHDPGYLSQFYSPEEGSPFQSRGICTAWSIPEALSRLPTATLDEFAVDPVAQRRYVQQYITHADGDGGTKTIDAIEQALAGRPIGAHHSG